MTREPNAEEFRRMRRFFDGPAWRWQFTQLLVAQPTRFFIRQADAPILEARDYLRLQAGGPDRQEQAVQKFPHIAAAERIAADGILCEELKVLVLGNCRRSEICERLPIDPPTLAAWEALYFDVRAMRQAAEWVQARVIRPEEEQGNADLAAKLKYACAGPFAAKAVLDAESRVSLQRGATLLDKKLQLALKFEQAAQLPLHSDRAKMFFLKLHADLMYREKRLQLEQRKLEQRSREALLKQQRADVRQQQAMQRRQERAAKVARREADQAGKQELERQRAAETLKWMAARAERQRAAVERAARSFLAQRQWQYSDSARADGEGEYRAAIIPNRTERAEIESPEQSRGGCKKRSALTVEEPVLDGWVYDPSRKTEKELCPM